MDSGLKQDTKPAPDDQQQPAYIHHLERPFDQLDDYQRRWLRPLGLLNWLEWHGWYAINWGAMRALFRLQAQGKERLPKEGPLVLTPNHTSSLDAFALAAALPRRYVRQLHWVARAGAVLQNPMRRHIGRLAGVVPVERKVSALAAGAAVLSEGKSLVWFPEGTRARDGQLRDFRFGIGALLLHFRVPAVPVWIDGAYEAMPPQARLPVKLRRVSVAFGEPVYPDQWEAGLAPQDLADQLHERVAALAPSAGR